MRIPINYIDTNKKRINIKILLFIILLPLLLLVFLISAQFSYHGERTDFSLTIGRQSKTGEKLTLENIGLESEQDGGTGDTAKIEDIAQMGAFPFYKADLSTPQAFYNDTINQSFDYGYGLQCVAYFNQFTYSLSGQIIATASGGASGYSNQIEQIENVGFTTIYNHKIQSDTPDLQNGDWLVFGGGQYGHIAMYFNGNLVGQNQESADINIGSPVSEDDIFAYMLPQLLTVFRPTIWRAAPPEIAPDTGIFYAPQVL